VREAKPLGLRGVKLTGGEPLLHPEFLHLVDIVRREGLRLAVPGVALGAIAGYIVARLLSRVLFGVSPADPLAFGATAAIEVCVTLAACALPAYRATTADPVVALRTEQH